MTNANFKEVKIGQRFKSETGTFVKIKVCYIDGQMRNAIRYEVPSGASDSFPMGLWTIGNKAVSVLSNDET